MGRIDLPIRGTGTGKRQQRKGSYTTSYTTLAKNLMSGRYPPPIVYVTYANARRQQWLRCQSRYGRAVAARQVTRLARPAAAASTRRSRCGWGAPERCAAQQRRPPQQQQRGRRRQPGCGRRRRHQHGERERRRGQALRQCWDQGRQSMRRRHLRAVWSVGAAALRSHQPCREHHCPRFARARAAGAG